jgi:signal transduction histidine kinase
VLYRQPLLFSTVLERALVKAQSAVDLKGQTLQVSGAAEVSLFGDPVRLEQMLSAYLGNAVKFTPLGGRIEIRLESDATEFRCEVIDDGVGIGADDLPHIFQPFFRVSSLEGRSETGAGLGLALTKRLSALHGGRVWAESEPGRGSRFGFALPRRALWQGEQPAQGRAEPS